MTNEIAGRGQGPDIFLIRAQLEFAFDPAFMRGVLVG
jgi:hypothetical protein